MRWSCKPLLAGHLWRLLGALRRVLDLLLDLLLLLHILLIVFEHSILAHPFVPVLAPACIVDVVLDGSILHLCLQQLRLVYELAVIAENSLAWVNKHTTKIVDIHSVRGKKCKKLKMETRKKISFLCQFWRLGADGRCTGCGWMAAMRYLL